MLIRDLITQIAASWPSYREKVRVDRNDPVFALVEKEFPEALQPYISQNETLIPEGSTGAGNITSAPRIAVFDRRLTTSATTGYYVVYLFSIDMSTVTLSLAFGTTQFRLQFGRPSLAFPRMRSAATRLQEMFNHLIPASMSRGPIDLGADPRQELHYAYQQSAILSYVPYRIGALPDEAQLAKVARPVSRRIELLVSTPVVYADQ